MDVKEAAAEYLLEAVPQTCEDDVPPGYKRTEVGVIPEDWFAEVLGKYATFRTGPFGSSLHRSDYVESGVPIVNPMQIVDGRIVPSSSMSVSGSAAKRLSDFRLPVGSVVIGRRGDMGRCAFVDTHYEGWLCGTGSMIIRPRPSADGRFLQRLLSSHNVIAAIENSSVGTTMVNLNQGTLAGLVLAFPPTVAEQRAIATALSDADALIAALQRLIAKKRAIKQGAMQALLTGCQRLPGFTGEWELLRIAEKSTLKARIGWQGLTTAEYMNSGNFYLVTGTDFSGGRVSWTGCYFVERDRYFQDKNIQLMESDVLLTKDGTIGKVAYVENLPGPATLNSGVFVIRPKGHAYDPAFFYYVLTSAVFDEFLTKLQAGSTISHLYQKDFAEFSFRAPATLEEQSAIATVLADMDAEIEALEARLAKTRALKAGMMQQLLTGRIRLPLEQAA